MFIKGIKKILIISAHADDMEFGCGATVNKLSDNGVEIFSLVLSLNQKGLSSSFDAQSIKKEVVSSSEILGIKKENVFIENFENRVFSRDRQKILDVLCDFYRKLKPDLVITTSMDDMHQDHGVAAKESFRAFKQCNILSYGFDWNRIKNHVNMYSVVSEKNIKNKIKALEQYKSQQAGRNYFSPDYIRSLALVRGTEIKEEFAETFEVIRLIDRF